MTEVSTAGWIQYYVGCPRAVAEEGALMSGVGCCGVTLLLEQVSSSPCWARLVFVQLWCPHVSGESDNTAPMAKSNWFSHLRVSFCQEQKRLYLGILGEPRVPQFLCLRGHPPSHPTSLLPKQKGDQKDGKRHLWKKKKRRGKEGKGSWQPLALPTQPALT